MLIPILIAAAAGYLLGALPFGYLVARAHGINIFEHGSKSPGATNVKRVLGEKFGKRGKRAGNFAFVCDALKGAAAAGWPLFFIACEHITEMQLAGLAGAVIGHSFSCFTRFKGGKGVATSAGGLVVLMPLVTLIGLAAWLVTFFASRIVSLASIVAAVAIPLAAWLTGRPLPVLVLAIIISAFVIFLHRANIKRLLNGTEHRFTKKPAAPAASDSRS